MTAPDPRLNEIQARRSSEPCDRHDWCAISDIAYLLAELRKAHEALAVVDEWIGKFENSQSSDAAKRENAQFDLGHSSGRRAAGSILRAAVATAEGDERG